MTTHDDTSLDTTLAVLPPTVRTFVTAHLVHDTETELSCFEPDATVVDDGHTFRGLDEIRELLTRAASEFTYTTTITEASADDDHHAHVVHHLEGDFPGGVVDLHYRYVLTDSGTIQELVIAP